MDTKLLNRKSQEILEPFEPPGHHKRHPNLIIEVIDTLNKLLIDPIKYLPHLQYLNKSYRQRYRQRLEAIRNIAQVLVYYTDFKTMMVCIPGSSGCTLSFIAEKAGITLKRCKRAIKDLLSAEYFESKKRCERYQEGVFKGLPSIKKLTVKFFLHLGFTKKRLDDLRAFKENQLRPLMQVTESISQFAKDEFHRIRANAIKGYSAAKESTEDIPRKITELFKSFLPKA